MINGINLSDKTHVELLTIIGGQVEALYRFENPWRAPGDFVKEGTKALVIEPRTMNLITAEFSNDEWSSGSDCDIDILAWCELPAVPSAEMLKELT